MSVVIKMDMPKSCGECAKKCGLIDHCAAFISEYWGKHDVSCERATGCPILCELPEKHGRLIDAEKVENITWKDTGYNDGLNAVTVVRERIRELPTIIEAEAKNMNEIPFPAIFDSAPLPNTPLAVLIVENGEWRKGYLCKCREEVKENAKKCWHCGREIDWELNPWKGNEHDGK